MRRKLLTAEKEIISYKSTIDENDAELKRLRGENSALKLKLIEGNQEIKS